MSFKYALGAHNEDGIKMGTWQPLQQEIGGIITVLEFEVFEHTLFGAGFYIAATKKHCCKEEMLSVSVQ